MTAQHDEIPMARAVRETRERTDRLRAQVEAARLRIVEARRQIESLRYGVQHDLQQLPELRQWLFDVLTNAEATLFRHRITTAGECSWCPNTLWSDCEDVRDVLDMYAPVPA